MINQDWQFQTNNSDLSKIRNKALGCFGQLGTSVGLNHHSALLRCNSLFQFFSIGIWCIILRKENGSHNALVCWCLIALECDTDLHWNYPIPLSFIESYHFSAEMSHSVFRRKIKTLNCCFPYKIEICHKK